MNGPFADQILNYIQGQRSAMLELLQHMVEAESPSSHPGSHRLMRATLTSALEEIGFTVRPVQPNGECRHIYARPAERLR